jgi:hypothetical protein
MNIDVVDEKNESQLDVKLTIQFFYSSMRNQQFIVAKKLNNFRSTSVNN